MTNINKSGSVGGSSGDGNSSHLTAAPMTRGHYPHSSIHTPTLKRVWRKLPAKKRIITVKDSLETHLAKALQKHLDTITLAGEWVGGTPDLREWALAMPEGWQLASLWLGDSRAPVMRYLHGATGHSVEIRRITEWGLKPDITIAAAALAMTEAKRVASIVFGETDLMMSPAYTGHEWLKRSIAKGREYPTLPDELQALIRWTSGQGRNQIVEGPTTVNGLIQYDGRLMYMALGQGLPTGPYIHDDRDEWGKYTPGRYRIKFTVPTDWQHAGILPVKTDDEFSGWHWPTSGTHETWCDGSELHTAYLYGWYDIEILERLLWPESERQGPVGKWLKSLLAAIGKASSDDARTVLRQIALAGIGGLHGAPRHVEKRYHRDQAANIDTSALVGPIQTDGNNIIIQVAEKRKNVELNHPEWTSAIWGKARARLLHGPNSTGALRLAPDAVVAFRTDALWIDAGHDPSWTDNGKAGAYRIKETRPNATKRPTSLAQLLEAV